MSKFSEKCKELLAENGSNVYRISKSTSLERTTLQRMVTGKRLPNMDFLKIFCKALRLSFSEEQELLELYKMEVIGESTYKSQKSILELFAHLTDLEKESGQISRSVIQNSDPVLVSPISIHPYDTDLLIHFVFHDMVHSQKDSVIYTNLPSDSTMLFQHLNQLPPQNSFRISVKHLILFHSNVADTYSNLESLNQILPLCFLDQISYEPYYYYRKFLAMNQEHMLYPYYIITSNYVVQLSNDLKRGILHSDSLIVQQYLEEFQHILSHASPLLYKPDSLENAMERYFCSTPPQEIFTLESSLCDSDLFSPELLNQLAGECFSPAASIAENYIQSVVQFFRSSHRSSFFTRCGAEKFCQTGIGSGTSGFLFSPINPPMRLKALQHFLFTFDDSEKNMLNDDFSFPQTLYLELRDNNILYLIRMGKNKQLSFVSITENSICNAFRDFFQLLQKSEYICPPEELKALISHYITQLKNF